MKRPPGTPSRHVALVAGCVALALLLSCDPGSPPLESVSRSVGAETFGRTAPPALPSADLLRARFEGAPVVVVGTVARVSADFGFNEHGDELILSRIELVVQETIRGEHRERRVFELEGGTVGELTLDVSDLPTLAVGDRGVFAVRQAPDRRSWVPWGRGRGILRVFSVSDLARARDALREGP